MTKTVTLELSREEFEMVRRAIRAHINAVDKRYDEVCEKDLEESLKDKHLAKLSQEYRFASSFEGMLDEKVREFESTAQRRVHFLCEMVEW